MASTLSTQQLIVVFRPLVTANGVPFISVVPEASAESVPQMNECLVLLPPALTTDRN
jgi:hypothetical protein